MFARAQLRGWSRLVAGVADSVVAGTVEQVHREISDGVYRAVGPAGRPVQRVTDAVTDGVYGVVRGSLRGAGEVGAVVVGHLGAADGSESTSPAVAKATAVANGIVDGSLLALAPELDVDMAVRRAGRAVPLDPAGLRAAFPEARDRIVLFVHGLVDTELVWESGDASGAALPDVVTDGGATPVAVRYGSGRTVERNGEDLAELLESLVTAWPVEVRTVVLVGHSMGGLLVRAALLTAERRSLAWPRTVTDVVTLGTPHLGSWLEKVANVGSWTLRRVSRRTAPLGRLLDARSQGIKDLRFGTLEGSAWKGHDPDDLLVGLVADRPWTTSLDHHLVVGRLRPPAGNVLNGLVGDGLVRRGSAAGEGPRRRIPHVEGAGGRVEVLHVAATHQRLVDDGDVAALLRRILSAAPRDLPRGGDTTLSGR